MRQGIHQREEGQAAVEAAIVLPLFVVAVLGILQLSLIHQAGLLTEYAAFQAARAGVVWNGDPQRMKDAAIFVLAPTACPTRAPGIGALCAPRGSDDEWTRQASAVAALQALSLADDLIFPGVHVHILNPHWPKHRELFTVGRNREELDFDDLSPGGASRVANVLTIQVQYWFELKIPIVDWVIWKAWTTARGTASFADDEINRGDGYRLLRGSSLIAMQAAAHAGADRRRAGYFIPIVTHHSMRMQSNFFSRYIRGCSCFEGEGCSSECRAW